MANRGTTTLAASAAQTVTGNSAALEVDFDPGRNVNLVVNVTAVSGTTPTLDLKVQWSIDKTVWADAEPVDTFTQITAAKVVAKQFAIKSEFYRLAWTIAGTTPSFTFSADAYTT